MKLNKIQIFSLTAAVAFVSYCAASEYSSPGDVTKTGANTTAGVYFDASALTLTSWTKPTTAAGCTSGVGTQSTAYLTNLKVSSGTISVNNQLTAAATGSGSSGFNCGEAQAVAYVPNAADNTWQWIISGNVVFGGSNVASQSASFTRAFSADLDKDGQSDSILYTVTLAGQGAIQVNRTVVLTSGLSCATDGSTIAACASRSGSMTQTTGNATLAAGGTVAFTITIKTQASTNNAGGAVSVALNGTTVINGSTAGLENPSASNGTGASTADPAPSGIFIGGKTAAIWAVLNDTAVPVNAFNITLRGADSNVLNGVSSDFFPTLTSLKLATK